MNIKIAKEQIEKINKVLKEIDTFDENHAELMEETGFLIDAITFLCDYKAVLNNAIKNTEILSKLTN